MENPKENFSITAHLMGIYLSLARFMKDKASHHLHNYPLLFAMLMLLIKTLLIFILGQGYSI